MKESYATTGVVATATTEERGFLRYDHESLYYVLLTPLDRDLIVDRGLLPAGWAPRMTRIDAETWWLMTADEAEKVIFHIIGKIVAAYERNPNGEPLDELLNLLVEKILEDGDELHPLYSLWELLYRQTGRLVLDVRTGWDEAA